MYTFEANQYNIHFTSLLRYIANIQRSVQDYSTKKYHDNYQYVDFIITKLRAIECHLLMIQLLRYSVSSREMSSDETTGDPATDIRSEDTDVLASWAAAIRQALMPIIPQIVMVKVQETITSDNDHNHKQQQQNMQQFNASAEEEMGQLGIQLRDEQDFSQRYQIFIDEILGSGQFGTVYGAY
ncbi:unnamed protein product [Onchocerca flexuosa]|uniref:Protein kinase domain-containing protein n=1 Tax=Onchocerca flexuosa TaxID=387005 RepID=A0A183H0T6_9BILA|nr:unnamed protein product [Onchocerca flexuosa]